MYNNAGTVTNSGTISGGFNAVRFSGSGPNRVVVNPGGVFGGSVVGSSSPGNTMELAGGTGAIAPGATNSGTVTTNGATWSYGNFDTLAFDAGSTWTLSGGTVQTVLNNGTISINGAVDIATTIDPTSAGTFQLAGGSSLEVAADAGAASNVQFLGSSQLTIDNFASFGTGIGTSGAAGPLLESFGTGDTVDLKQFAASNVAFDFDASSGLLKVSNGTQTADLFFQTSSLGAGTFQAASDSANGVLITHA